MHTYTHTGIHTDTQTYTYADMHTGIQANTGRMPKTADTGRQSGKMTYRDRQREAGIQACSRTCRHTYSDMHTYTQAGIRAE